MRQADAFTHRRFVLACAGVLALSAVLGAGDSPPRDAAHVRVFILAGQSNLTGRAPASGLPEKYRTPPANVRLDYLCSLGASETAKADPSIPPEPHRSNGWTALRVQPKHVSTPAEHFGPEIGLGHALAAKWPEERIAIIKNGRGATSLAEDWRPDAATGKKLYAEFLAQVRADLERLKREGSVGELCALVWVQGEADTTRKEWAEAYQRNFAAFVNRMRRDLGTPHLPLVVVLTGEGKTNPKMIAPSAVREAQRAVVAHDPCAMLVTGDDLSLLDSVHYDAPAQITLGERIAAAYFAATEKRSR